ncbi:hypothetical protein MC7420_3624 [Coleofasciculus chthonoplastes PCC 7420]|uniref:Glycosyltransferase family 1 protein n=1 Tax=Coleofasciculus chthonoplastes PCC 7420 TaxID=118168 RepID=B4VX53_9CYAN|nr:hypothetical protein [Coleofasciculus chthonoplastes]EDX73450.1 hypothetical protein MC7420_3624 [Coleofasciculus chthonoplastes PCC 7420]
MNEKNRSIYFYIPRNKWPDDYIPEIPENYWQWYQSRSSRYLSMYHWILQTYLHLKADGFPCQLIDTMPTEGIVLSHRYSLPDNLQPQPRLLIVCIQADNKPHPYAQLHLVQNPTQETSRQWLTLRECYYIPHWTHPGLIPRDPSRGNKFENIAFFGYDENLAPELKQTLWYEQLNNLGLNWYVVSRQNHFNDYSYVDAILAVRSFQSSDQYNWKPATKLHNAWRAGVPAILGCESAFRSERKSELDYIEVASLSDVISALKRLRDDLEFRQAMVDNGKVRAEDTEPDKMVNQWKSFLINKAIPAHERWCSTPVWRQQAFLKSRRYVTLKLEGIQRRLQSVIFRLRGT